MMNKKRAVAGQRTFKRHEEDEKKIRKMQNNTGIDLNFKIAGKSKGNLLRLEIQL